MSRRAVALILVVDLDDPDLTNAALVDRVLAAVKGTGNLDRARIPYAEVHDDLDAVLDEDTAARYRIGD